MRELRNARYLLTGVYAWILAVFLGAVLLDIVYANLLEDVAGFRAGSSVYSTVADFLLLLGGLAILLAVAAIVASWEAQSARNFLLGSLLLLVGFEFLAPMVLVAVFRNVQAPVEFGPLLRLVPTAVASLLAFSGSRALDRAPSRAQPA
jgi:hypothetical protein